MEEDLKAASTAMSSAKKHSTYTPMTPKKHHNINKVRLLLPLFLLILGIGAYTAWALLLNNKVKFPEMGVSSVVPKVEIIKDTPSEPLSQTYKSTKLGVSFKHPFSWTATEANNGIRVESPLFTYNAVKLGDIKGNFRIYIRRSARPVDSKFIGRGVTVKTSDKLTYTKPVNGQNKDTLLSTFGIEESETFGFFLITPNYELVKNETLGTDYGQEPDTYIIAGGYTTTAAVDDLAANSVKLEYYSTTNAYKQAMAIIASLQLQ